MSIVNLEDLEKLTEKLYGPQQDPSLTLYEKNLSDSYIQNYNRFSDLFEFFVTTNNPHCQFWVLNCLINLVQLKYESLNSEEKANFRKIILFLFESKIDKIAATTFINGKFCLLLLNWMINDFPENWPSFFNDILGIVCSNNDEAGKIKKITTFVEFMIIFDDELIRFRHIQEATLLNRATIIKDFLRTNGVAEIVGLMFEIIKNHKFLDSKLVKNAMKVIARLIDWNLLNIFTDCVNYITDNLISSGVLISESLEVINSIIHKGMDAPQKVEVIKYLKINQIIDSILRPANQEPNGCNIKKIDESIFFCICEIVANLGTFANESYDSFKNIILSIGVSEITEDQQAFFAFINELANYAIFHSMSIINMSRKFDQKSIYQISDFLSAMISFLKNNEFIIGLLSETLKGLVKCLESNLVLPKHYDLKSTIPSKDDEELNNFRKEFFNIYNNLYCLKPMKEYMLKSILEKYEKIASGNCDLREVELSLFLLNLNISFADSNSFPEVQQILNYLYNIDFSNFQSKFVLQSFFETSYKYIQYKINDMGELTKLLKAYFSPIGIMNQDLTYSSQVSVILNKVLEKLKSNLDTNSTEFVIYSLKDYFESLLTLNNFYIICENAINFNSLSIVIGVRTVSESLKAQIFEFVLHYFNRIIQIHGIDEEKFNEIAKIITNFLKSVGYEVSAENKKVFVDFFNNFVNNCYLNLANYGQNTSKTKYSLITVLQRLIIILGKESISFLAFFFQEQIKLNDTETFEDTVKLLSNSVQILKKDSAYLISEFFANFFLLIKAHAIPTSNISEVEKNVLSLYGNFVKLMANITAEVPEILFTCTIKNFDFNELINLMILICCNIVDSTTKRSSFKCLKSIALTAIKLILENPNSENCRNYLNVVEYILHASLKIFKKLNLQDPLEVNIFSEIISTHCLTLKNLGDYYISFIQNLNKCSDINAYLSFLKEFDKKPKMNEYINAEFKRLSEGQ